ncbi:MAG: type III-B CRISPR module-associated Cmr3 family protein, partial [Chloroflexota bacterium]
MKLFFEPSDFLFFRDGKPFSGGEVSFGSSMELPLPSVVYGAIRTRLLQDAQVDFTRFAKYKSSEEGAKDYPIIQLTGTSNTPGSLYIGGPYFASLRKDGKKLKEIFFPVPLDVVKQHSKDKRYNLLEPDFESSGQTNFPLPDLAPLRPKPRLELKSKMEEATGFLNLERMQNYLDGSSPVEVSSKNFVQSEQRIGIA